MNVLRKPYIIILCFVLIGKVCSGQRLQFKQLTEENVFDRQPVLSIAQDSRGRLWFAGGSDLYRYDSQRITNLAQSDSSITNIGYITKIATDQRDNLFIATNKSLFIYDIGKQQLITEKGSTLIKDIVVLDICTIADQTFLCTTEGLYSFSKDNYQLHLLLAREQVYNIVKINKDQYALASQSGIELVQFSNGKIKEIQNLHIPITLQTEVVLPSLFYEPNQLWVASKFNGLFHYDLRQKKWSNFNEKNSNLLSDNVRKIKRDSQGRLLVGTLKGLSVKEKGPLFTNYKHDHRSANVLSQNSIYDIFVDNQQIVWLGTYFGGLNAIYPDYIKLNTYSTRSNSPFRLTSDVISSMGESADFYWIATEEDGIAKMRKQTGHTTSLSNITKSNLIKDLYVRHNKVYIAQYGAGYAIFDINTNETSNHTLHENFHHAKNNIYSIYVDSTEKIYLGTNEGLYQTFPNQLKTKFVSELGNNVITEIQEDREHTIYVLTNARIYKKGKDEIAFQLDQLGKLDVNGFSIDKNGNLWITTQESVYKKSKNGKLEHIARFAGNNLGWPIYVHDKLWITSTNGLVYYDPSDGYSTILSQQDGLPLKNMQAAKLFLSNSNDIFVTTLSGLVSFNPDSITFNKRVPAVILRDIVINDTSPTFESVLSNDADNSYALRLAHNENFLTINFSSSNFIKPQKNRFKYRLEGFDKDWIESSTPTVRYTNIPKGQYTLIVYASNNDMVWSTKPLKIAITVLPPFWKTWWAYLIYALAFTCGIHFIIKFIVEREILINNDKEHEKKIKFFTQVSHEIRTPLTLITAPLDEIIAETADQSLTQHKVKRIKKNANKLLTIVNELLDFRKFDDNKMVLKKAGIPLREYVEDSFYLLADLARSKNINYYISRLHTVGIFQLDTQQFDKVLFNLLANAIKYTPENGTVYLELLDRGDYVDIRIADNGIGISKTNQFKIFEEYYREEQAEGVIGTGIGLALTKNIVEQHSGTIRCLTETLHDQEWTVFTVSLQKEKTLPLLIEEEPKAPELPLPHAPATSFAQSNEMLLIVDDNLELLSYVATIFQNQYTLITAHDGEEGLQKAKTYLPDLIISDMMMPRINGSEFCRLVKTDLTTSHIPFILLTAATDSTLQTEALEHGANIYISKPFDSNHLFLSVHNLLQVSKAHRKEFAVSVTNSKNELDKQFIHTLDQLIEQHLTSEGFDVNFIAKNMGMSAPILYKKLKSITDLSLNNYVKIYRLTKAKQLLQTTLNVNEVAWAVGFSDRKYFSKEFKKQFGLNPTEFITKEKA